MNDILLVLACFLPLGLFMFLQRPFEMKRFRITHNGKDVKM